MRFLAHPPEIFQDWPVPPKAYITGVDKRVFACRVEHERNLISLTRTSSESGKLSIAWPVEGYGRPITQTCTLPEREEPYLLPLELARGKIAKLRDQLGVWQIAGMVIPKTFPPLAKDAQHLLAKATQRQDQPDEAGRLAQQALTLAFQASDLIVAAYTQQRLEIYRRRSTQLPALLGCNLGTFLPDGDESSAFLHAFNAAFIPVEWGHIEPNEGKYNWGRLDEQVEWCQKNKVFMHGGPLLDMTQLGLPEWLWKWKVDFLNLQSFVSDFVETAISRYFGKIRYWEVSACGNTGGVLDLTEEQRLTLTARSLEVARQVDDEIQLSIRIDQPWGGYLSEGKHRLSPLQYIDALLRSSVGLSSVNLEIAVGFAPRKTGYRDVLEVSQLIDLWSGLGIPLQVTLAFPSSNESDPNAKPGIETAATDANRLPSVEQQANWLRKMVPLLMAKQSVVGLYWTHYTDELPHCYPHAGMKDIHGKRKPAIQVFDHYRTEFWNQ